MSVKVKKIIAVVLAISSLLALCSCSAGREKINLEDFITIEFSKYNGYGTAHINVDEDSIETLIDYEKYTDFVSELSERNDKVSSLIKFAKSPMEFFDFELAENYTNLSNGDKVKVVVISSVEEYGIDLETVEKGLGINFKDTEITYKVEGLVDAKTLDVFEGFEYCIEYVSEGYGKEIAISGESKAVINIPDDFERIIDGMYFVKGDYNNSLKVVYNNERLDEIRFSIEGTNSGLSTGDIINVIATGGDGLEEYDYIIPELVKEYKVPELAKRLESKSQLTADTISKIKSETLQYVKEELGGSTVYEFYYFEIKPSSDKALKCGVIAVADYSTFWRDYYTAVEIRPIILCDGTWEYEMSKYGQIRELEKVTEKCFDHENYTFEKI